jgi:hypothetical protein
MVVKEESMTAIEQFLARYPNASPCHGGGVVIIGESIWKKVWVWGGFSQRMADRRPIRRQKWKHIETIQYSAEFDFEKLGWNEACRLAWEDAVGRVGE